MATNMQGTQFVSSLNNPDLVTRAIRDSNSRRVLIGVIVVLIVIGAFGLSLRYLTNFFGGPRPISTSELTHITSADGVQRYWVSVKAGKAYDTGWQEVEESNGNKTVTTSFSVITVGRSILLISQPGDVTPPTDNAATTYSGALVAIPSDVDTQVVSDIRSQAPDVASQMLPFMLDTRDFRTSGYVGLLFAALAILLALWLLFIGLTRIFAPHTHPLWTSLKRFGDPQTVADSIRDDMAMPHTQIGKVRIGSKWIVANGSDQFRATQLEDVVWLYNKVTRRRVNGIPTGKTFEAQIWDRYGKLIGFSGAEAKILAALTAIRSAAPWAIGGYSAELEQAWKKNRAEIITAVDQKRAGTTAG